VNGEYGVGLAFGTGILGAFHCIGMCGGVNGGYFAGLRRAPRVADMVLFHAMRIGAYTVLGVGGALLGRVVAQSGIVGKAQGLLMMLAGIAVVVLGLNLAGWLGRRSGPGGGCPTVPLASLLPESRRQLPPLAGGLLNGLVPCSLVFSVAIQAAESDDPLRAGLLMLAFGAGTLPAMAGLSLLGAALGYRVSGLLARLAGVLVAVLGIWAFHQGYVMYDVFSGLANW